VRAGIATGRIGEVAEVDGDNGREGERGEDTLLYCME